MCCRCRRGPHLESQQFPSQATSGGNKQERVVFRVLPYRNSTTREYQSWTPTPRVLAVRSRVRTRVTKSWRCLFASYTRPDLGNRTEDIKNYQMYLLQYTISTKTKNNHSCANDQQQNHARDGFRLYRPTIQHLRVSNLMCNPPPSPPPQPI